jgi:hypothetical protein
MKRFIFTVAILGAVSFGGAVASANVGAYNAFNAHYNTPASCTSCHTGTPGTITPLGNAWKANGGTNQAGPSTQAGWDALDATYAATYGGVNPSWSLSSTTSTSTKGTATTTGCVSNTLNIMALLSFLLLAMLTFASRKKVQELGE